MIEKKIDSIRLKGLVRKNVDFIFRPNRPALAVWNRRSVSVIPDQDHERAYNHPTSVDPSHVVPPVPDCSYSWMNRETTWVCFVQNSFISLPQVLT